MRVSLRSALPFLATLALAGCAAERAPAYPVGPAPASGPAAGPSIGGAFLWGVVLEHGGGCIAGATLRVVGGQALGDSLAQRAPCGPWDDGGFEFRGLISGVPMIIRASAAGYVAKEVTVTPDFGPQTVTVIELDRVAP